MRSKKILLVFNISLVLLSLELLYTRIYSTILWYHFAFLVVSLALLGLGSGSIIYHILQRKLNGKALIFFTPLIPLTIIVGLHTILNTRLDPNLGFLEATKEWLTYYIGTMLPFLFGGLCLTSIYTEESTRINRLYFADLMGAGVAAILVVSILPLLGGENSIIFISALASLAVLQAYWGDMRLRKAVIVLTIIYLLAAAILVKTTAIKIKFAPNKNVGEQIQRGVTPLYTRWNAFSRVDIINGGHPTWGLSNVWRGQAPQVKAITIDMAAETPIIMHAPDRSYYAYDIPHIGMRLRKPHQDKALIIGSGGGTDVLAAAYYNYSDITAVEINPLVVEATKKYNPEAYNKKGVRTVIGDGRGFIRYTPDHYDMVYLSMVDTWAAIHSGAYSLSENFLYTKESIKDYLGKLEDEGMLSVTRWQSFGSIDERLRLLNIIKVGFWELNVSEPEAHIMLVSAANLDTFLVKKTPFTDDERAIIIDAADKLGFAVAEKGFMKHWVDVEPDYVPTDDRPFFFKSDTTVKVFKTVFTASMVMVAIFLILPLITLRRIHLTSSLPFLLYFSMLGMGFMLLEIPLIQRFTLLLGSPTLSLTVILFSLLTATSIGSLLSRKLVRKLSLVSGALLLLIFFNLIFLSDVVNYLARYPLYLRVVFTVIWLLPVGLLLGVFFPAGITHFKGRNEENIPWMIGLNSVFSVVGATLAPWIAVSYGFKFVLFLAIPCYLVSFFLLRRQFSASGFEFN